MSRNTICHLLAGGLLWTGLFFGVAFLPASAVTLEWTRQLGTSTVDDSSSISADRLGNVYISGYTGGSLGGPNAGSDDAFVAKYFDGLPGDYNHNGIVDVADCTIWRDTLGSTTNLAADGNGNGVIDAGDLTAWKTNFGNHAGSGAGANATVPEPSTLLMLFVGILTMCCRWRAIVS